MNTTEHLAAIVRHIDKLLAIAEKRTQGEWYAEIYPSLQEARQEAAFDWVSRSATFRGAVGMVWQGSSKSNTGLPGSIEVSADNAVFIGACAGNAEAGWRATKAAIEGLSEIRRHYSQALNPMLSALLDEQEEAILAAWPVELLKEGDA